MPTFADSPETLKAQLKDCPCSDDIPPRLREDIDPQDEKILQECFFQRNENPKQSVAKLKKLAQKYPKSAHIQSELLSLLHEIGDTEASEQVLAELIENCPTYVFAYTEKVAQLIDDRRYDEVPQWLGESLCLQKRVPEVDVFHPAEFGAYYSMVAHYHLTCDRPELAQTIADELEDRFGKENPDVESLLQALNFYSAQKDFKKANETAIHTVVEPRAPLPEVVPEPDYQHPAEMQMLMAADVVLNASELNQLLSLPPSSLIDDLEKILRHVIDYGSQYESNADRPAFFVAHALFLLGELDAKSSLPTVLDFLSLEADVIHFWLLTAYEQDIWVPLHRLVDGQFDKATAWMQQAGISGLGKALLVGAIGRIADVDPDRRQEILSWLGDQMEFMAASPVADNIADTQVASELIWTAGELGATELEASCIKLAQTGLANEFMVGDVEMIKEDLATKVLEDESQSVPNLSELYETIAADLQPSTEEPDSAMDPFLHGAVSENAPYVKSTPDIGRNDPCPCGSGKKYKKCCS